MGVHRKPQRPGQNGSGPQLNGKDKRREEFQAKRFKGKPSQLVRLSTNVQYTSD